MQRYIHAVSEFSMRAHERAAAWLVTGPLGHFAGGLYDWSGAIARVVWARARGRRLY
jgi:hypothetical protein